MNWGHILSMIGMGVMVGLGVLDGSAVAVTGGDVGVWNWSGVARRVAVLKAHGVEVGMAVGRSGRVLVPVGEGDTTTGSVGGIASAPPSGAAKGAWYRPPL